MNRPTLVALLREAAATVSESEVPGEFAATAFSKAVDLLRADVARPSTESPTADITLRSDEPGSLERLETHGRLGRETVERLYSVHDGFLRVIAPPSRLPTSKRAAMRDLIILTTFGRQVGGWDDSATSLAEVRSICESYGQRHFDGNNFTNALNDLGDYLRKIPASDGLMVKLTPPGFDHARETAERLGAQ